MLFPTLYKKTSTGADQQWTIEATSWSGMGDPAFGVIRVRFGQVGGKIQETEDIIKTGKNTGKKNETSAVEQAQLEAKAQWEKKLKKGYVQVLEDAQAGKTDEVIEGGIFPMLAHKFSEQGHKIIYPAFAQPKFDGHRCIAVIKGGMATLWTRTRKQITGLPHIVKALETWALVGEIPDITLDGELYNHEYRARFEELSSFIRTPEAKPGHEVVQYHIYDIANTSLQASRVRDLREMLKTEHPLVVVETIQVADEDELMLAFESFLAKGYEGCMVRNAGGRYANKRSYDLQKVKEFDDAEFLVIGVEEGRGKLAGHAIFVCRATSRPKSIESLNDPIFKAKMKGETSELKKYFEHPELAIGKLLTVRYQGITNKSGVPRFPVGIRFRED